MGKWALMAVRLCPEHIPLYQAVSRQRTQRRQVIQIALCIGVLGARITCFFIAIVSLLGTNLTSCVSIGVSCLLPLDVAFQFGNGFLCVGKELGFAFRFEPRDDFAFLR